MNRQELLVELVCEELPARFVRPALEGLRAGLLALLGGVERGEVRTYATPRRLAVVVDGLATHQPAVEKEILGPPADKAFADGVPTEAGIAFAKGKGADPATLRIVEVPKRGAVTAVTVREGGAAVVDLLRAGMADLVARIPFAKSMTWGDGTLAFGRPLHRINVVFGGAAVSGEAHGIAFGAETVGHRLRPGPVAFSDAATWLAGLRDHLVEPDLDARAARIRAILDEAAAELGADPIHNDELAEEVLHLVEWPVKVVGTFDADLLQLPPRLLVTSMRVHQRYFPVTRDGAMTNRFVVISNNPLADAAVVAEGNARVLRARFYDARFFLREDQHKALDAHGEKLVSMRWIRGLGTMAEKGGRLSDLGGRLSGLFSADVGAVQRAAALSKCDLATQMVGEFPELQGHMGRVYAAAQGEGDAVAWAIEEHYLPRFAGDDVAGTPAGRTLAVADRLDTLVGCFGVGIEPKGGGDPQGLRRAALGLLHTLVQSGVRVDLAWLFQQALTAFHAAGAGRAGFEEWTRARGQAADPLGGDELVGRLVEFAVARLKAWQVDRGRSSDLVDAALGARGIGADATALAARVDALAEVAGTPRFVTILLTAKRLQNILDGAQPVAPEPAECPVGPERDLREATLAVAARVEAALGRLDDTDALDAVLSLADPVEAFFKDLMVNDPDPATKARRQGIVSGIAEVFARIADFSRISTR